MMNIVLFVTANVERLEVGFCEWNFEFVVGCGAIFTKGEILCSARFACLVQCE